MCWCRNRREKPLSIDVKANKPSSHRALKPRRDAPQKLVIHCCKTTFARSKYGKFVEGSSALNEYDETTRISEILLASP